MDLGKLIAKIRTQVKPSDHLDYKLYLENLHHLLKNSYGKGFSYSTLAEILGFGKSTVIHQIAKGYRPLSKKNALKISKNLKLDPAEEKYLLTLAAYNNSRDAEQKAVEFQKLLDMKQQALPSVLDRDLLDYFKKWYVPVIREMVLSPEFNSDPKWIAQSLDPQITIKEAQNSLELLERIGYIKYDREAKKFVPQHLRVSTGAAVEGMGLQAFHSKMLELSQSSLFRIDAKKRDLSALTIIATEQTIPVLKQKIRALQIEILDLTDQIKQGDQVYQVNIQLFPVTKNLDRGD